VHCAVRSQGSSQEHRVRKLEPLCILFDIMGSGSMKAAERGILSFTSTFTGEKMRGALTSVVTGSTVMGLNAFGVFSLGLSAPMSALLFVYVVGGVLGYSADIMFAKSDFMVGGELMRLPYGAVRKRGAWLMRSFFRRFFVRYFVTLVIETLTGLAMLNALIREMDKRHFLTDYKTLRDATTAVVVAVLNFLLYGNVLRFDWAYREVEHPVMNMVVLAWMGVSMLTFAAAR